MMTLTGMMKIFLLILIAFLIESVGSEDNPPSCKSPTDCEGVILDPEYMIMATSCNQGECGRTCNKGDDTVCTTGNSCQLGFFNAYSPEDSTYLCLEQDPPEPPMESDTSCKTPDDCNDVSDEATGIIATSCLDGQCDVRCNTKKDCIKTAKCFEGFNVCYTPAVGKDGKPIVPKKKKKNGKKGKRSVGHGWSFKFAKRAK